jgi:MbtH protein
VSAGEGRDATEESEPRHVVVRSIRGDYSLWPDDGRALPPGWDQVGFKGSREECLVYIEIEWQDE